MRRAAAVLCWLLVVWVALICSILLCRSDIRSGGGVLNAAYLALQMLFANGSVEDTSHPVLAWLRLLVPWTFPLLGVLAVVDAVRVRLSFLLKKVGWLCIGRFLPRMLAARDLVLVIGLGRKGLEMVHAELAEASVVVIEREADNPLIVQAEAQGAVVWVGDGQSAADLKVAAWKRPARIWVMTNDSVRNLLVLDMARGVFSMPGTHGADPEVNIYSHIAEFQERRDAAALSILNRDGNGVVTHLFSQEEAFAEWLLRMHPVRPAPDGGVPRVLLVGMGPLGRAIFRELLLLCHFPGVDLPEIVMVDTAETEMAVFREMPFLEGSLDKTVELLSLRTQFRHEDAQGWRYEDYRDRVRGCAVFTHVFICMGSEVRNLTLAERIDAWEGLLGTGCPLRIVPVVYNRLFVDFSG